MTRIRGSGVAALVSTLIALAGCNSGQNPNEETNQTVSDGRYCGLVSTELAAEALGTDALRAEGKELSDSGNAECTVDAADDGVRRLQITVNLEDTSDYLRESAPAGCEDLTKPSDWVGSWGCWALDDSDASERSFTSYAIPAKGQTLRVIQSTPSNEKSVARKIAPRLLADINDAVVSRG